MNLDIKTCLSIVIQRTGTMTSTARTIYQTNIFFEPMNELFTLLNANVQDINSQRATNPDLKARQWVFPTTPEANDENYPRIALIPEAIKFEEFGAGRWLQTDVRNNSVVREKFGRVATVPITIGVFCKKGQKHKVVYFDDTTHQIQNSKQSDYLGYLVSNVIEKFRNNFISKNMDIKTTGISTSYEDNDFLWAKNIDIEILIYDVWQTDYSDGDLIKHISMNLTATPTGG